MFCPSNGLSAAIVNVATRAKVEADFTTAVFPPVEEQNHFTARAVELPSHPSYYWRYENKHLCPVSDDGFCQSSYAGFGASGFRRGRIDRPRQTVRRLAGRRRFRQSRAPIRRDDG